MVKRPDKIAFSSRFRLEFGLWVAALIGLASFFHELLLTDNPSWVKLIASTCAIIGAPAAIASFGARTGGQP